jgi:hypothetical protein
MGGNSIISHFDRRTLDNLLVPSRLLVCNLHNYLLVTSLAILLKVVCIEKFVESFTGYNGCRRAIEPCPESAYAHTQRLVILSLSAVAVGRPVGPRLTGLNWKAPLVLRGVLSWSASCPLHRSNTYQSLVEPEDLVTIDSLLEKMWSCLNVLFRALTRGNCLAPS